MPRIHPIEIDQADGRAREPLGGYAARVPGLMVRTTANAPALLREFRMSTPSLQWAGAVGCRRCAAAA